jgi:hypothetical protein
LKWDGMTRLAALFSSDSCNPMIGCQFKPSN